jgi:hypothetical protein
MNDISANLDDHPIEIAEVNGRYVCIVPTLLLTASDNDLTVAYAEVRAKRQRLIEDARAAGVADRLSSGAGRAESALSATRSAGLASFAIRTSIVTVAAALLLVLAGTIASMASRRAADAFASRLEAAAPFSRDWDKRAVAFQEWLFEAAASRNQPTPAQEAKIRESLRILVTRFRPYLAELAPLTDPRQALDPIVQPPSPVKN